MKAYSSELIRRLESIVKPDYVIYDRAGMGVYELDASDESIAGVHTPDVVVLPETAEQIAAIVRVANDLSVPVIVRGAGTGLAGGTITTRGGILLVTARMNHILEVNETDRYAVVEPGVINLDLTAALLGRGYYYAPDPASQKTCTIGGNIANNSGGPHCLKYGVTGNHILGLEVVLADGEMAWFGGASSEMPGFDLTGVMVGGEGTLGIVTRAMVRISRRPEASGVLLAAFPSIDSASRAVSATIAAGIIPASMELMDHLTITAIEVSAQAGYPKDAAAVLLIELDGLIQTVAEHKQIVAEICDEYGATEVRVAQSKAEEDALWLGRKSAFGAMGRLAPNYHLTDTVVPRTKLPLALERVAEVAVEYNLKIANVFHAGDGNLHPLILFDRNEPGAMERVLEASEVLMQYCIDLGGAVSGEHGIGIEKQEALPLMFTDLDLEAMAKLKRSFDPENQLNPGKVFPTSFDPYQRLDSPEKVALHVD
ncbi:MAG: FAD-binding protein [Chloroflexia bacterium]|nr:FAD-binding protein [Chloroflexia bacterium]